MALGIKQEFAKKWTWSAELEHRFDADWTRHKTGLIDVAIRRKLSKHWSLGLQFRARESKSDYGGYVSKQRLALCLQGELDAWGGELKGRLMVSQSSGSNSFWEDGPEDLMNESGRIRVGYQTELKEDWDMTTSFEAFHNLTDMRLGWKRARYVLDLDYRMSKRWKFGLGYFLSREWNNTDPWTVHVVRLKAGYSLKKRKRKKSNSGDAGDTQFGYNP